MSIIRAFVGHSFTDDDKNLVNTFLEYFDQIQSMDIGFTWDHAKLAKPIELAEKVKSIIQDKNLFIGICTKKELVIGPTDLETSWLKRKLSGRKDKFLWKTSDWIIQEIGLALGREMDLILLIEDNVQPPGRLQGNVEYIPFNRDNPERSFGKILEMIQALRPKADKVSVQELGTSSPESADKEHRQEEFEDWWSEPNSEWGYNTYKFSVMLSIKKNNHEAEKKITEAFKKTSIGQDDVCLAEWEAYCQYVRLSSGKGVTLIDMEQLAKDKPEVAGVHNYLGKAYEIYKEYGKAAEAYIDASEKALNNELKLSYLEEAAKAYYQGDMKQISEEILVRMKQEVHKSGVGEKVLVKTLRDMAELQSDTDVYYGLSERLLELKPDDNRVRFSLAYKYSQNNEEKLSIYHYLRIPEPDRGGAEWNNLGVQYDNLKMVVFSIRSYRKAEQINETLAMSNIANRLINAGFLPEAEDICNKAIAMPDYHKNVNQSMARIKDVPDEELKKEAEIIKDTARYSDFYRAYGKALYETHPEDYNGEWEGPECNLAITIKGLNFLAEGSYETTGKNALLGLASAHSGGNPSPPEKHIVKYIGTIQGHSIKVEMTDEVVDIEKRHFSLLASVLGKTKRNLLMIISDSFEEIRQEFRGYFV
jgi:tetratricopeptide (TPR) repeat protein